MFVSLLNKFSQKQTGSLASQFNNNLLRFISIFQFLNINMFASLWNKFVSICHHNRSFNSLSFR